VTIADTLIKKHQGVGALGWLLLHCLEQHTAPVRVKPDSKPRLEGARYRK